MNLSVFRNKRVFLTGHTGFKGAWLAHWLCDLGADVHGFALDPPTQPALYDQLALAKRINDQRNDIRDAAAVAHAIADCQPDFVFHLAAQSLVRHSYAAPVETYDVNVLGSIHVLQALRALTKPCAAIFVTTDKCYENREWLHGYREEDPLGGHDPYSSSKAAAEIAIASFRRSFFQTHPVKIASARAGNVIGGGDWALDRIVPDCIRAVQRGEPIPVRNKIATRPWQHVLEPLSGYLWLAANLAQAEMDDSNRAPRSSPPLASCDSRLLSSAFNFGPALTSNKTVADLVQELIKHTGGEWTDASDPNALHEASKLNLVTDKAFHVLGWQPVWSFEETVARTAAWYLAVAGGESAHDLTLKQIQAYQQAAGQRGVVWAREGA